MNNILNLIKELAPEIKGIVYDVIPGGEVLEVADAIITNAKDRERQQIENEQALVARLLDYPYKSHGFDDWYTTSDGNTKFDFTKPRFIDVQTIFHKKEQRTLAAAYKFYCGKDLTHAHSADADTMATYEVLMAQLEKYDIPADVDGLAEFTAGNTRFADFAGRIAYDAEGVEIFNFGKYKGQRVADVFRRDTGYYGWIQQGDFPQYTKNVFTRIYLSLRN